MMTRAIPWLLSTLLAIGCVCTIVYAVRQEREQQQALDRDAEAARLRVARLEGAVVVEQKRAEDIEAELTKVLERNAELEEAVKRVQKASPGARPVAVVQASTGPLVCNGPEVGPQTPRAEDPFREGSGKRSCVLFAGDKLDLRIDQAILETRAGNQLVVGTASAWKLDPETKLTSGAFESRLSSASGEQNDPVRRAGWGVGPSVWGSSSGLAYGAMVSPPPLDVWRLQVELAAGLGFGDGGVSGSAAVLGRVK